jgi:polar amino acid transport system ATP-binding protein/sulfate transport system ATP-binding protein
MSAPVPLSTKGEVLVKVDDVSLRLGDNQILDKVAFDVFDRIRVGCVTGQVVGLLGPSGVGKTRLLRIIAGLDPPDSGRVLGPRGASLEAGAVGVVFQDYPLLRHRSVEGNLALAGKIAGLGEKEAKTRSKELLEKFRLADRANFYPAQLSGGQRQRVAIAQQLVKPRTLLLMDEPFSGLDPAALDEVMRLIVEVANLDELNTVVVVTHDIRAAMAVSDTLFMLGRRKQENAGACIQCTYDLVDLGLAWHPEIHDKPEFSAVEREIKLKFKDL